MAKVIIRTAKLTTYGQIGASAAHTLRERETPNADSSRTPQNENSLVESSAILDAVKSKIGAIKAAGHVVRETSVKVIEYLMTASPDADIWSSPSKTKAFFDDAKKWLQAKHGADNIVSWHIQRDEKTPHAVAYVVPKTKDGRLCAKDFLGGRKLLSELQDSFAEVGSRHGLERGVKGSKTPHQRVKTWYALANSDLATPAPQKWPKRVMRAILGKDKQDLRPIRVRARLADSERNKAKEYRMEAERYKRDIQGIEHELSQAKATNVNLLATIETQKTAHQEALKEAKTKSLQEGLRRGETLGKESALRELRQRGQGLQR